MIDRGGSSGFDTTGGAPGRGTGLGAILIVEDEDAIRQAIVRALGRRGYQVFPAVDGTDAMRILHDHSDEIGLVLTDVAMPMMSGNELVAWIEEEFPDLPIVLISGYSPDLVEFGGSTRSRHRFVQKPFSLETLTQTVAEALDERG